MTVATRLCRAVLPCLLAGALGACRDLSLPDVGADGGVGPDLTVVSPREGQTIPLNAPVNVQAVSVNGVASVTVTCGGAPSTGVFTWNVAPYTGVVDFTRCSLVTTGATDAGFGQLQITFIAVDRLGHTSTRSFSVFLDTTTAALSAVLPERVVPLAPLQLTVGSDRPLLLPPTVRLAGREADGVLQRANPDGGAPLYDVTFLRTPGLGIDTYGGDPYSVPFEVLSDVERQVGITVDARATNGNASHLEQGVLLSRVLWDRSVPGRIAVSAADPVATAAGVQVPLATRDAVPGPTAEWLPGFFRSADGTYVPFDPPSVRVVGPSLPPGPVEADAGTPFPAGSGYFAVDVDGRGRVLMARPSTVQSGGSDVIALGEPSGSIRAAASYTVPFPLVAQLTDGGVLGQTLTRVDDLLCLPDSFSGSQDGCWYPLPPATQTLRCVSLVDGAETTTVGSSSTIALGPPTPGGTAGAHGSARTYLAPNDVSTSCGPVWALLALPGDLFVPQDRLADPAFGAGCFAGSFVGVHRLLPFPDGSFAVLVDVDCPAGQGWEVVKVNANGAITGSFLAPQGVFLPDQFMANPPLVLAALADGSVVTMRNEPPNTVFEAWPPDGTGPSATARVPGLYVYGGTTVPRLGRNVMAGSNGSLTVLLNGATLGDVVLHFGPGLQPRWIYRYPLLATTSTLVAADGEPTVYYVDPLNNALVALDRRGGASGGSSCVVNGVSVVANPSTIAAGATSSLTATVSSSGPCSTAVSWSVSPSGGTLSADGNGAVFSSPSPGTFTITATSVADPTRSGSATVSVTGATSCGPPNGTVVTHASNIGANETWAGGGVTHSVPGSISINGPATVTIQPCAIVSLAANATITVNAGASLVAAGTGPGGSISFVRANSTQPWGILRGTSATSLIDLSWTTLQGGGAFGGQYGNPAIAAVGNGYFVAPVATVRVNNVVLDSPQGGGVYFDAGGMFTADSTGLTVQGAPGYVLSMGMMSLGSVPAGSYASPSNALPMVNVVGTFNVTVDTTIHNYLPVRIQSGGFTVAPAAGNTTPVTLTVEPGARVLFPKASATTPGARVIFGTNGNPPNNLVGVLNAQGTAAQPIVFTSGEAAPAPGDWVGLWLDTAVGSRLDHVVIEYAGAPSGISAANCKPAPPDNAGLFVGDFSNQYVPPANLLTNSTIRFSAGYGIDAIWQTTANNTPDLSATNTFTGNALCAQTFNSVSGVCPSLGCTAP